ncbi:MAG TPA: SIMPL domain-containing protein [Gaiellaceae bacterium]|nr:SIMPL domain-containing protein [Gaiellaceae bacterium]
MTKRLLFLIGLFLLAAAVAGVAQPRLGRAADTAPAGRTITTGGSGSVTTVPDRATFTFGADARAATAKAALAQANGAADALVAALKRGGVADADLQTSDVSLTPQTTQDGTRVTGYVASTSVTATTTIANAGPLVDAAVAAGATNVSGPSLSRADTDALYRDALKRAVADARAKADALAAASGLTLGAVRTVVEGGGATPVPLPMAADGAAKIEPGTQTVDATVTVTFDAAG